MKTHWYELTQAACFVVSGRDARRYLHNRLSNDIRSLSPGATLQAAALTAQGRVEGLFEVACQDDQRFVLVADGGDPAMLQKVLARYVVADRVVIEEWHSQVAVVHVARDLGELLEAGVISAEHVVCAMRCARITPLYGTHLLVRRDTYDGVRQRLRDMCGDPLDSNTYDQLRWQAGVAVFPTEVNEDVILTECRLFGAVSFSKGCYVGQEVIERSDAIGRLPRTLERVVLDQVIAVSAKSPLVAQEDKQIGRVISSVVSGTTGQTFVFALLKTGAYKAGDRLRCEGAIGTIV
jgi:folate-binding protein YgfZ